MKLLITGATGLVGTEAIRQALLLPSIKSVVALARKEVPLPANVDSKADTSKFKSVVVEDFEKPYANEVKEAIRDADACLWLLAVTPTKAKNFTSEEVKRICHDYTINGLESMSEVANKPFRFIYTSGAMTERDQTQKLMLMGEYRLMRGEIENQVLAIAAASSGAIEPQITKPGIIDGPGRGQIVSAALAAASMIGGLTKVHLSEITAAMLDQAIIGLEKDTLENADLIRIGQAALKKNEGVDYVE